MLCAFVSSPVHHHAHLSSFLQDSATQLKPAIMADACLVVDVLGVEVRGHIIERYSAFELKEYRRIFRTSDEAGQLDNISRRFAWFRRLLQTHEVEQGRVFPVEWRVSWHLFAKFAAVTRLGLFRPRKSYLLFRPSGMTWLLCCRKPAPPLL